MVNPANTPRGLRSFPLVLFRWKNTFNLRNILYSVIDDAVPLPMSIFWSSITLCLKRGPKKGNRNNGAKTHQSNIPAARGTSPTANRIHPMVPLTHTRPMTISAAPAIILIHLPNGLAIKRKNAFIVLSPFLPIRLAFLCKYYPPVLDVWFSIALGTGE